MAEGLDILGRGIGLIADKFGATAFVLQQPGPGVVIGSYSGSWNDLGRVEEVTLNGKRVRFSVLAECGRAQFATLPKEGMIVTRSTDGAKFRIVGEVQSDELTVRFPLDSVNK